MRRIRLASLTVVGVAALAACGQDTVGPAAHPAGGSIRVTGAWAQWEPAHEEEAGAPPYLIPGPPFAGMSHASGVEDHDVEAGRLVRFAPDGIRAEGSLDQLVGASFVQTSQADCPDLGTPEESETFLAETGSRLERTTIDGVEIVRLVFGDGAPSDKGVHRWQEGWCLSAGGIQFDDDDALVSLVTGAEMPSGSDPGTAAFTPPDGWELVADINRTPGAQRSWNVNVGDAPEQFDLSGFLTVTQGAVTPATTLQNFGEADRDLFERIRIRGADALLHEAWSPPFACAGGANIIGPDGPIACESRPETVGIAWLEHPDVLVNLSLNNSEEFGEDRPVDLRAATINLAEELRVGSRTEWRTVFPRGRWGTPAD